MSHLDLWDLKPDAPAEIRGEFSQIDSTVPGIRVSELLPRTARMAHKLAIVRSMTHDEADHERAISRMSAGFAGERHEVNANQTGTGFSSGIPVVELQADPAEVDASEECHEPQSTQREYGLTRIGQGCFKARQLVEAGRRLVRIESGHWDTHRENAWCLKELLAPSFDQAFAALVNDLDQRGLLDSTLVVAATEFGRSPRINSLLGRDHWPGAFSIVMAGAGVNPGQVIGATDHHGACVADRPISPHEVTTRIHHLLGFGPLTSA
jgi:hypothetical protein